MLRFAKKQLELFDFGLLPEGMRMMAAWSLVKLGDSTDAIACLNDFLFKSTTNEMMLHNVLDWMGEPAFPLVKKFLADGGSTKGKYGISILGRVGELQGWQQKSPDIA